MRWFYTCYEDLGIESAPAIHVRASVSQLRALGEQVVAFVPSFSRQGVPDARTVFVPAVRARFVGVYLYQLSLFCCLLYYQLTARAELFYTRDMGLDVAPVLVSKLFGRPHVIEVNGHVPDELRAAGARPVRIGWYGLLARLNLRAADRVVAVTEGLAYRVVEDCRVDKRKVHVVHNGVDTALFRPAPREATLDRLGLPRQSRYLVYVGGFYPYHGLEQLVASLPAALHSVPNLRLLLVGDGYCKPAIVGLVEGLDLCDVVSFCGSVSHHKVPTYINAADVCVLFSDLKRPRKRGASKGPLAGRRFYFDPLKMYEYFACGKPLLTNILSGAGRFVQDIGAGVAVDINDPQQVAGALANLLADEKSRQKMGQAGRNAVRSWGDATREILHICRGVFSGAKGGAP